MKMNTIGFIGLGLIGGSIAKAIRAYHPEVRMMAYMRSQDTLQTAVAEGVIDVACTEVSEQFAACDLLFLCAPVETNARYLEQLKPVLPRTCLLTDVGSTKTDIHEKVDALGLTDQFIGGNPMAGSEKSRAYAAMLQELFHLDPEEEPASAEAPVPAEAGAGPGDALTGGSR